MKVEQVVKEQTSEVLGTVLCFLTEINIAEDKDNLSAFAVSLQVLEELENRANDKKVALFLKKFSESLQV